MFIAAGHSNLDPGAVKPAVKDMKGEIVSPMRREADIAVEMRNIVSFYLQRDKIPHELDGFGTVNMPLNEVVKRSKKHKVSLEFHCNASAKDTATGVEILCAPKDNALAAKLCAAIAKTLGIRNRGVKPENAGQHHRLAFVQAGGMIVELFFITNHNDLQQYDAKKWLVGKEIAQLLKEAV